MATGALITAEKYLATHFEREPEFVHGELVERSLPANPHSKIQQRLCVLLDRAGSCRPELRLKLAEDLYRIPDVCLYPEDPKVDLPTWAPLLAVEIGSPDDRLHDVEQKLDEYRVWGVAHIWFVEPEIKKLYVYERGLVNVQQLALPQFRLTITPAQLFS